MIFLKVILFVTFVLSILIFFIIRKFFGKNYVRNLYDKRLGIKCYTCSEVLVKDDDYWTLISNDNEKNLQECISCKRERRLNLLMSFSSINDWFKKWIISKKSEYISLVFMISILPFVVGGIILNNHLYGDIIYVINYFIQISYWITNTYRVWLCRK